MFSKHSVVFLAAIIVAGAACGSSQKAAAPPAPEKVEKLSWIDDDLDGALARGKQAGLPVFVDMWAPWCHACISMKSYVLGDPGLSPLAGRFVWAAVDTEKESNAKVLGRYPVEAWPSFYILDPADGSAVARWPGTMSTKELRTFLEDGERTVRLAHAGQIPAGDPLALVLKGDRASMEKRYQDAADAFGQARAKAPAGWPYLRQALSGEMRALRRIDGKEAACMDLMTRELDTMGATSATADFISYGIGCVDRVHGRDADVKAARQAALGRLTAMVNDRAAPLSADDRGDIWSLIADLKGGLGDPEGAKEAQQSRIALLDAAAAAAPDAQTASTYDGARLDALLALGRGADAVRVLSESERKLPDDYNPPARLARAHYEMGQLDEALAAIDRAMAKAYGPRKLNFYALKADILEKQGKRDAARAVVEEEVKFHDALPATQQRPEQARAARERLKALR